MHPNDFIAYTGLTYHGPNGSEPALEALDAAFAAYAARPCIETLRPYRTAWVAWQEEQMTNADRNNP